MEEKESFYAYVTKYALTRGIQKLRLRSTSVEGMVTVADNRLQCFHAHEWHHTWLAAEAEAIRMRTRAIISAQNKVKRLENLTFKKED